MDKFGFIDIFTKLAQDKNVSNLLSSTINSLLSKPNLENKNAISINKTPPAKRNNYSQEAILNLLKRHNEISKNIDKNLQSSREEKFPNS